MSTETESKPQIGSIGWHDLTVPNAEAVRDFYCEVVGWKSSGLDMGGYEDFCVIPPGSEDAAGGICHARGANADFPAQWLMYVIVEDVARCAARCVELGGEIVVAPRDCGGAQVCVIRDPAGAVCGLYQP